MFVLANILTAVAQLVDLLLGAYIFVLIAYCLISWVNPDPYNPIVRILRNLTEPVLWRVRKYIPFTYIKGIDLSPIIVLLAIQFIRTAVISSILEVAVRLRLS